MGSRKDTYLAVLGMLFLELVDATMILINRVALVRGFSPRIFVFYRDESCNACMNLKLSLLIFITAFIGIASFQNLYIEGLYLTSASVTSAMFNLVPAITFLMATILGLERICAKRLSYIAKVVGTALGMGGAIGLTLLNAQAEEISTHNWLIGCLLIMASVCCWSSWLILQTGIMALVVERDPQAWILTSYLEVASCLFSFSRSGVCDHWTICVFMGSIRRDESESMCFYGVNQKR